MKNRQKLYTPPFEWKYGILPTPVMRDNGDIDVYFSSIPKGEPGASVYGKCFAIGSGQIFPFGESKFIFGPGQPGLFDCHGVNVSSVVYHDNCRYLYYVGYQRTEGMPYMLFPGLVIINGSNIIWRSKTPLIDRNDSHPYSSGAPFVMKDGNVWKMWYWIATGWTKVAGKDYLANNIAYAESHDGITWLTKKTDCLTPKGNEFSLGRPWVIKSGDKYIMYYCARTRAGMYRINVSVSNDGITWREGAPISTPSDSEWDSEMVAYPAVVQHNDKMYMFYNGNQNGLYGFGVCEI